MPRVTDKRPTPRGRAPQTARHPRVVADRPSWLSMQWRRQRRLARPALGALVGLSAIVVCWSALRSSYSSGSLVSMQERIGRAIDMRVDKVVIEGRANTPEPLLRAALGVSRGDPMFGFSVNKARDRIESLSWVRQVAVERRLPGTIVVSLTEKRPFAIWQTQGRFQLIDRNGAVVTNEDVGAFGNLPLVVGTGAPDHATALLDLLAKYPALQSHVVAAVRVGGRRWNLRLKNGADVMLPEGAEEPAVSRLMELQTADDLLDRPLSVIDLRLPDRLIVRPQPDTHADSHSEKGKTPDGARDGAHMMSSAPKRST